MANDVGPGDDDLPSERGFIGRSRDSFTPLGPALVTADEIRDPQSLALGCTLSGEPWQQANTKEMRVGVDVLLSRLSQQMTLEPGDVVLTGTPQRVASGERARRGLRDGDLVVVEIAGLGRLASYVRGARRTPRSPSGS